jgi:hypothetical protein
MDNTHKIDGVSEKYGLVLLLFRLHIRWSARILHTLNTNMEVKRVMEGIMSTRVRLAILYALLVAILLSPLFIYVLQHWYNAFVDLKI